MPELVAAEQFRAALRRFASGVTVVTCVADGVDHAMTASAFSSVSLEPPQVLVCVRRTARFAEALRRTDCWGVSILDETGVAAAQWFATSGRPLVGQLDRFPHRRSRCGVALLEECLARMECRTVDVLQSGDHDIVVGAVEGVTLGGQGDPLVYWSGGYRRLRPEHGPSGGATA